MPIPTPFHARTSHLCKSAEWRNWSGYMAVVTYQPSHEREYYAIRNSAGLLDVSPLYKYEITGPDAARLVDRIITRDITKCKIGQVLYTTWCDEAGKMIDDGTVQRFDENHFIITSTDPNLRWFRDCGYGMDAEVEDISALLGALALQGPTSRDILKSVFSGADMDTLKFFYLDRGEIDGIPVTISRTGYTGDLGYEIWVEPQSAPGVYDALMEAGRNYGILPSGLAALDIARIEACLLLKEIDYVSTQTALIEARKSSPYEAGLGWAVKLNKKSFVGRQALLAEKEHPAAWRFVGVEVDWVDLERLFNAVNLPPLVAGRASRLPVPVYKGGEQVGYVTSSTFSPILKKFIGLCTIKSTFAESGSELEFEITVEFQRKLARAKVVETPFFNPERKRSIGEHRNEKRI